VANIQVGESFRGRIVNALGTPVDGKGGLTDDVSEPRALESRAPSIMDRRSVHEPFAIAMTAVDAMIPIGRGQRELIIGDHQTGKTTVAVDAILNQVDVVCVYVAVGSDVAIPTSRGQGVGWASLVHQLPHPAGLKPFVSLDWAVYSSGPDQWNHVFAQWVQVVAYDGVHKPLMRSIPGALRVTTWLLVSSVSLAVPSISHEDRRSQCIRYFGLWSEVMDSSSVGGDIPCFQLADTTHVYARRMPSFFEIDPRLGHACDAADGQLSGQVMQRDGNS
jgi:hypothetical protein